MAGVPFIFGNATTAIPLSNLDANFNTGATIGNTTVGLGNTVTKSFTVMASYTSNSTITFAGGSTIRWSGGTTPTPTATTGKVDIFNFYQDGTSTFGAVYGQNF